MTLVDPRLGFSRLAALLGLACLFCLGGDCSIEFEDGGGGGSSGRYTDLTDASATLTVTEVAGAEEVGVEARIRDAFGRLVRFAENQGVGLNEEPLVLGADERFRAEVPVADQYIVVVREPTRGVFETTVAAPPGLVITAPADGGSASLGGFLLTWAGALGDGEADPPEGSTVEIVLMQTFVDPEGPDDTERLEIGDVPDTGEYVFTAAELATRFFQGAPLLISVTRRTASVEVAGFRDGTLRFEQFDSVQVRPGP